MEILLDEFNSRKKTEGKKNVMLKDVLVGVSTLFETDRVTDRVLFRIGPL